MIDKRPDREDSPEQLLELAVDTARQAGELLRQGFGTAFHVANKEGEGRHNLVTEFDNAAEELILGRIRERYPDHSFLAEESGAAGTASTGTIRWIVDPLDGTVNFAHGLPIFSVSIAAELNGELLCGAVYQPMLDEMFSACKHKGARLNGKGISVSGTARLNEAILVTGFPYNVNENPGQCIDHFARMLQQGIPVRRLGSAALDLAYVAAGRFDAFWEVFLHPWDFAAGRIIVEEAGGCVTRYDKSAQTLAGGNILATNGLLHDDLAAHLH